MGEASKQLGMGIAADAASSVINTGMGMALAGWNDKRQLKMQKKLQDMQAAENRSMALFNNDLQMKMWNETNYAAQMAQLKKAGLNPGLMYGMGGGGGATTAAAQAQGVSGGNAPSGGGEIMGMMQMGLMSAQRDLIKAQAAKTKAETANVPLTGESIRGDIRLKGLEAALASATQADRITLVENAVSQGIQDLFMKEKQGDIMSNVVDDEVKRIKAEAIGAVLRNELTEAGIDKTRSDITVNEAQIKNWITQNAQGWQKLSLDERNTKVNELLGEFNMSLSREALGALGGVISTVIGKGMTKGTTINKHEMIINR